MGNLIFSGHGDSLRWIGDEEIAQVTSECTFSENKVLAVARITDEEALCQTLALIARWENLEDPGCPNRRLDRLQALKVGLPQEVDATWMGSSRTN